MSRRLSPVYLNEKLIREISKNLMKEDLHKLIEYSFTKADYIEAVVETWKRLNVPTNNKIERYFNVNFIKQERDDKDNI